MPAQRGTTTNDTAGDGKESERIVVRAARPEECRPIAELDSAFFPYAGLTPRQVAYYRRKTPELVLVAAGGRQRIAGFLIASLTRYAGVPELHIISMGVVRGWRRCGIGRRLLMAAIRRARRVGAGRVGLEVWTGNRAALGFYRTLGFETIRRRRGYYEPGRDAFVMQQQFGPRRVMEPRRSVPRHHRAQMAAERRVRQAGRSGG